MLDSTEFKTSKPARPRKRPEQLAADKDYDARWLRYEHRKRGIRPEFPKRVFRRAKRKTPGPKLEKRVARFVVERTFSWYQRKFRRLVVRWERKPENFQAFVLLGFSWIWLQRL